MTPERIVGIIIAAGLHAYFLLFFVGSPDKIIEAAGDETGTEVEVELAEAASEPSETLPEPTPPEPVPPVPPEPMPPEPEPEPEPMPIKEDVMEEPEPPKEKPKPKPKPPQPKPAAPRAPLGVWNVAQSAGANTGATGGAIGGSKDSSRPRWKRKVEPPYPTTAKTARVEGRVTILISVSAEGRATSARVTSSSGNSALDDAAQRAAMASSFYPTVRDGVPVADTVPAPYRFTLQQ